MTLTSGLGFVSAMSVQSQEALLTKFVVGFTFLHVAAVNMCNVRSKCR